MLSTQYKTRNKYQKIKCPICNSISKAEWTVFFGLQRRRCRKGHVFFYSYFMEALYNWALNYRIKF
jgi:hypothetical protein